METLKIKLEAASPLMMHKDTLCDPLHPLSKAHKALTSKRKKTDEDHEAIMLSEWRSALHYDKKLGPYVPGQAIQACFMNAAKEQRLGTTFKKAFRVLEEKVVLQYDGPRDIDTLAKDDDYRDVRAVVVQRARLMRCRPIFQDWKLEFEAFYMPSKLDREQIVKAIEDAGLLVGLLEMRPVYGRFHAEVK